LALAWVSLVAGCGGRQMLEPPGDSGGAAGAGGAPATFSVGAVDFTKAPTEIPATCPGGFGAISFQNPCLVGQNLDGQGTLGVHEVECHLDVAGSPAVWSFLLVLSTVSATSPTVSGPFPQGTAHAIVTIGGVTAAVDSMTGTFTFSQIDPQSGAFVARFQGTVLWTEELGQSFRCTIDAPFWGAPGGFA
jgi:hypothetical protein